MKKGDSSMVAGLLAALLYGVVSGSMSFMNKTLLSSYDYHYPDVIMLLQVNNICPILSISYDLCPISYLL